MLYELFTYYFGDDGEDEIHPTKVPETQPKKRPPAPRADHHIGTELLRYKIVHTDKQRRRAIKAGIEELKRLFMLTTDDQKKALDLAIDNKRKRLILIRTLQRSKPSCRTLHSDVLWLYYHYKLDTSGLAFRCSTPKS